MLSAPSAIEVASDFWRGLPYTIHIGAEAEHSMSGDIPIVGADVITELVASDPMSAKVFASMAKLRGEQIAYTDATEGSFIKARKLPYKFPG